MPPFNAEAYRAEKIKDILNCHWFFHYYLDEICDQWPDHKFSEIWMCKGVNLERKLQCIPRDTLAHLSDDYEKIMITLRHRYPYNGPQAGGP